MNKLIEKVACENVQKSRFAKKQRITRQILKEADRFRKRDQSVSSSSYIRESLISGSRKRNEVRIHDSFC
jgi:hypothetical protein